MNIPRDKDSVFRFVSVLVLIFAIIFGLYSAVTAFIQYNSPTKDVNGTIVSSEVDSSSSGGSGVSYYIDVEYEYSYNGTSYINNNVKPGESRSSVNKGTAEDFVAENEVGDNVTVYVNENNPSSSWLINDRPTGNILTSVILSLGAVLILYLKYIRRSDPDDD